MDLRRRNIIKTVGLGTGLLNFPVFNEFSFLSSIDPGSGSFLDQLFEENDEMVSELVSKQNRTTAAEYLGGFPDRYGIYHPGSVGGAIQRFSIAYSQEKSSYFKSPKILDAINLAIDFLLRVQHDDGTIDLLTTNFHSTPDLAFVVEPVALGYAQIKDLPSEDHTVLDKFERFFAKAGQALSVGGIHTPNHRWVVSMALARIYHLFPNRKYIDRIDTWLKEKIDIDVDGQYTERSTGVYSPLTDRCLITMGHLLDKPLLYDPVRKNLDTTLFLTHPNGEVVTEISRRQDQFRVRNLAPYYYSYLFLAHLDDNPVYGAMARLIEQNVSKRQLSGSLVYLLENPALQQEPKTSSLPVNYVKHFKHLELIRIRRNDMDVSILAKNATFFTFHRGMAVLQAIRFASAFFGKGQFIPEKLDIDDNQYLLTQSWKGPYYQPYPQDKLPDDGDWDKMPKANRPQSEVQTLQATVKIFEEDDALVLDIQIQGTDRIPLAVELAFRKGGIFAGVKPLDEAPDSYVFAQDFIKYTFAGDEIQVSGFKPVHQWTQLRGALPKVDADCVYLTGFTPFKKQIKIY